MESQSPLTTKAVLLQVLLRGPAYGKEIMERVKSMTKSDLRLHAGSVYPAFESLARSGLVRKLRVANTGNGHSAGGRPVCVYALTKKGRARAERERDVVRKIFRKGAPEKRVA